MSARILLVMPGERQDSLAGFLSRSGLQISTAASASEAERKLGEPLAYDLLLADAELPDGNWRDLLGLLKKSRRPCDMVVCSRCGDERFWAEVLECGVFDLIPQPYDPQEILRIVRTALKTRHTRQFSSPMESSRAC